MSETSQSTQPITQEDPDWDFSTSTTDISDAATDYEDRTYNEYVRYMHLCEGDDLPKRPMSGIDYSRVPSPTLRLKCVCCNEKLLELEERIRQIEEHVRVKRLQDLFYIPGKK